jgi:hypothetical protein
VEGVLPQVVTQRVLARTPMVPKDGLVPVMEEEFSHVAPPFLTRGGSRTQEQGVIDTSNTEREAATLRERAEAAAERASAGDQELPLELRTTTLAEVCRVAIGEIAARYPERTVEYAPDPDRERQGRGEWDARRVAYAVTILLEDALKRTRAGDPVSLRWREHDDVLVLRVQYPRPLERADQFVTCFENGVPPDGADDRVGILRIVAARKLARQHGGSLARIRTRAGTAYVLELPRSAASAAAEGGSW